MQFQLSGLEEDPSYHGQTAYQHVQSQLLTWNGVPHSLNRVSFTCPTSPFGPGTESLFSSTECLSMCRLRPSGLKHCFLYLQIWPIDLFNFSFQAWDRVPLIPDFGPIFLFDSHCHAWDHVPRRNKVPHRRDQKKIAKKKSTCLISAFGLGAKFLM